MRVLVCGGRDYNDLTKFVRVMKALESTLGLFDTIIHGGAFGADSLAHLYVNADRSRHQEMVFQAEWKQHGKAAGPIRNQQMLDEGKPDLVIAFPGGRGTADMIRRARSAGVQVHSVQ